ncbi:uncharacterized protein LOC120414278 [Culex pipiens pallens]|uniref:uncharacterized protein LOC120414278 n=1 Tax=Culex pipiens pallens TaxID=42434 RepID=UPI00195469FE|nr:uncharacterized protein LOC120414278 [Culex pipiens pallens]
MCLGYAKLMSSSLCYKYIPNNPADCASRGNTPLELLMHPLFYGPSWLKEIKNYWRIEPLGEIEEDELLEMRTTIPCPFASAVPPLCFQTEIDCLVKNAPLPSNSKLKALFPFVDADGTLRVGGRLQNSNQPYDVRHPMIIPKEHRTNSDDRHTQPKILDRWLPNGGAWLRCELHALLQNEGENRDAADGKPAFRMDEPGSSFRALRCGLRGSIPRTHLQPSNGQDSEGLRRCLRLPRDQGSAPRSRSDLSTSAFLTALKRMFVRRGISSEIWSDHRTNFVGANRRIREHLQSPEFNGAVNQYLSDHKVKWTFITPSAPHMGGIWEAAVKSMKKHLRVVLGNTALTSASPDSYEALTPGHFIINQPLNLLPEPDISHIKEGRLDKWQRIQRHVNEIWARWRDEYVATLQHRNKWQTVQQNLDPGQLVLIKNENTPPAELARIVAAHPDPYGVVRNVTVRRGEKDYQRPVHKLVPLPMD